MSEPGTTGGKPERGKPRDRQAIHFVAVLALLTGLVFGCAPLRDFLTPSAPGVPEQWARLVDEIRVFERRIGFTVTGNFLDLSEDQQAFPFCGYASPLVLPYSYEDPAIQWGEADSEQECQKLGGSEDWYFGRVEAIGEANTPVTLSMVESRLDRFLYLVFHEDCHDQYQLPYGVEEALCNLIAYKAMAAFTAEKFGRFAREDRAIRRYAELESRHTRVTKDHYDQLAAVYARHERKELSGDALIRARENILARAKRNLAWQGATFNNIVLASHMTYSRHYAFLESVHDELGGDLARTITFFRYVDRVKPTPEAIMAREKIRSRESVEFVRAYETAVVETARKALAEGQGR